MTPREDNSTQWVRGAYTITTDQALFDFEKAHDFIARQSYWGQGIPMDTLRKSAAHSLSFGMFHGAEQIGFARVVTDRATFGYLADVFIDEAYRGQGLGKWFIATILAHPELQGLRRWMLATRDAHGLYAQNGFTPLKKPETFMERHDPEVYQKTSKKTK
ncbi:MAG: GNAT family N-acetyltransferase [Phaeodactylibacter sp.]|nr:GNAT family N-acetyltransferase [Phaeodactylibacter sp.]MCB9273984.1 GNAT family N-acetyltransferase [Lewinellaceae bacterium]